MKKLQQKKMACLEGQNGELGRTKALNIGRVELCHFFPVKSWIGLRFYLAADFFKSRLCTVLEYFIPLKCLVGFWYLNR